MQDRLESIERKVQQLITLYSNCKLQLADSQRENQELKEVIEEQKKTIESLKEKSTILKIVKTTESKEGTTDAKLKINELIREIDKCIGLLQV